MKLCRTTAVVAALAMCATFAIDGPAHATTAHATTARRAADAHPEFNVYGSNYTPIVGDFNGDGFDDIFWYAPGRDHVRQRASAV
ncbi:MAG TPA: FG-GAP repeat protein [Acidimicrobiia bacterium]|jgi:hypothetical protein